MAGRARTFVLAALVVVLVAGARSGGSSSGSTRPRRRSSTPRLRDAGWGGYPERLVGGAAGPVEEGFVGYRIEELFGGETIKKTAVGRTPDVTGSMTVAGVDQRRLDPGGPDHAGQRPHRPRHEDDHRRARDRRLPRRDLHDHRRDAAGPAAKGTAVKATVSGELELHGETKAVEVPVEACWTGATIRVTGSAPYVLADSASTRSRRRSSRSTTTAFEFELTFVPTSTSCARAVRDEPVAGALRRRRHPPGVGRAGRRFWPRARRSRSTRVPVR